VSQRQQQRPDATPQRQTLQQQVLSQQQQQQHQQMSLQQQQQSSQTPPQLSRQRTTKEPAASLQQFSVFSNPLAASDSPLSTQQPAGDARQPASLQDTDTTPAEAAAKAVEMAAAYQQQDAAAAQHAPSSPAAVKSASHSGNPSSLLKHSSLLATKTLRFEVQPAAEYLQHQRQQHNGVVDYNGHDQEHLMGEQEGAAAQQQYTYSQVSSVAFCASLILASANFCRALAMQPCCSWHLSWLLQLAKCTQCAVPLASYHGEQDNCTSTSQPG
jgi:hypothetical protein